MNGKGGTGTGRRTMRGSGEIMRGYGGTGRENQTRKGSNNGFADEVRSGVLLSSGTASWLLSRNPIDIFQKIVPE